MFNSKKCLTQKNVLTPQKNFDPKMSKMSKVSKKIYNLKKQENDGSIKSLMFLFRVIGLKYVVISPYGFEISIFIVLPFLVPPTYKVFFTAYM